jgi:hypothetical protein
VLSGPVQNPTFKRTIALLLGTLEMVVASPWRSMIAFSFNRLSALGMAAGGVSGSAVSLSRLGSPAQTTISPACPAVQRGLMRVNDLLGSALMVTSNSAAAWGSSIAGGVSGNGMKAFHADQAYDESG